MAKYQTITSHDCFEDKCAQSGSGCERFICWELPDLIKNKREALTVVIFDKIMQKLLINLSLTPIPLKDALIEHEESGVMFVSGDDSAEAYVSLHWVLSKDPPKNQTEALKAIDEMIMEQIEAKIPQEGKAYLLKRHICPGTQTIN